MDTFEFAYYTMDDHHTNGRKYPACALGHVWLQWGNRTGHCAKCHQTFEGITLFDAHQRTGDDGRTICRDAADMQVGGKPLHFKDGSWRYPAMTEAVKRARFGAPTDSGTETG